MQIHIKGQFFWWAVFKCDKVRYTTDFYIRADKAEKSKDIPGPTSPMTHLLWPFSCLCSHNNRYFPSSKNLSVHMVLRLRGLICIHKLHECKASRLSVREKTELHSNTATKILAEKDCRKC